MTPSLDRWTPMLVGGAVGGGLSVLPPFCLLSCCCCCNGLYFVVGGMVAGIMLARAAGRRGTWLPAEQGLVVGLGAGLIAALMTAVVFGSFEVVAQLSGFTPRIEPDALRGLPPELQRWMRRLQEIVEQQQQQGLPMVVQLGLSLLIQLTLGLGLGALGGLLGVLVGRRPPTDDRGGYAAGPAPGTPRPTAPAGRPESGGEPGGASAGGARSPQTLASRSKADGQRAGAGDSAWDRARRELEQPGARRGNAGDAERGEPHDEEEESGSGDRGQP